MEALAWWLIPITATLIAVAWVSWRGRPRRPADPHDTLAAHRRFTDALQRSEAPSPSQRQSGSQVGAEPPTRSAP